MTTGDAELPRLVAAAAEARARLHRSASDVAAALAAAATSWQRMPDLVPRLAGSLGLAPVMVADGLTDVVAPFDAGDMTRLAERECAGAPSPPPVVAHVLASNVPALALPAIAHTLLAGAAVVVKSGRHDPVSAPTFHAALATVDPELAATVVCVSWPRGDAARDAALLACAPVVVITGSDAALSTLAPQATGRVLAFGTRGSVALLCDPTPDDVAALARDVALWEQRGCLSPHAVFVGGDAAGCADGLGDALAALATRWPPVGDLAVRAARRTALEEAGWRGASVQAGPWGAVIVDAAENGVSGPGGRVIRVHPIDDLATLPERLPTGTIECVGTNVDAPDGLAERGVARVCTIGRMQRPTLAWPRGRRPPIRMLLDPLATAPLEIDR